MRITVFRSTPNTDPAVQARYKALATEMAGIVTGMPGFISIKRFAAADGEACTIVEFADEASHRAWVDHPAHGRAMDFGKAQGFLRYDIKVCELLYTLAKT